MARGVRGESATLAGGKVTQTDHLRTHLVECYSSHNSKTETTTERAGTMSKIATQIADTLMASYAGQTVDTDTLIDRIEIEYLAARKRAAAVSSYFNVLIEVERRGAVLTGIGQRTFPNAA